MKKHYLKCTVDDNDIFIRSDLIEEISSEFTITPIPGDFDDCLLGVAPVSGDVSPVYKASLFVEVAETGEVSNLIFLNINDSLIGIAVDKVDRILSKNVDQVTADDEESDSEHDLNFRLASDDTELTPEKIRDRLKSLESSSLSV